ncbi:aminotransferase class V-fold PLP-dependent enzyme [Corallococcus exercitus]|nr:aminotransferase class V-fold PLP-dependent enzyme [Corallococcus exercitus]
MMAFGSNDLITSGAVREDFPILTRQVDGERFVYLDSAATALKPRSVIDAVTRYYTECTANIHRGRHRLSEEASDLYEEARGKVALMVGCASNEVIFVRNTTEGLNLAASCMGLKKDDLVVGFLDAHHSQLLPWMRGGNYQVVRQGPNWQPDLEHYAELLRRKPKAVVVTHCSNVTGGYLPLETISKMAHDAGALVVVDAAQSVAHCRLRFTESNIDFLALSAHKMLGPSGIGCLVGRASLLRDAEAVLVGGGVVDFTTLESFQYRKIPHKFEAGTPAIEAAFGFAAAIDYLDMVGLERIQAHDHELSRAFLEGLKRRPRLKLLGPDVAEARAPIFSLYVEGLEDLSDVSRALSDAHGVMCRNGHLCAQPLVDHYTSGEVLRMSAYLYNTVEEVEYALSALDEVVRVYQR